MIKRFTLVYFLVWVSLYLLDATLPAKSSFDFYDEVLLLNLSYVGLSALVALVFYFSIGNNKKTSVQKFEFDSRFYKALILISFLGALGFFFDKVIIQGIDYTEGLSSGRNQLRDNREGATGISSPASALGYIFGGTSFYLFLLTLVHFEKMRPYLRITGFVVTLITVATISFLTGGRSSLMLLFGVALGAFALRKSLGLSFIPFKRMQLVAFGLFVLMSFSYLVYVFQSRADEGGNLASGYTIEFIDHLNGETRPSFDKIGELPPEVSSVIYLSSLVGIYATHANWTFEGILELGERRGSAMFISWRKLLAKFGLGEETEEWYYHSIFVGWPGAIYHDYGFIGLLVFAVLHGILIGLCQLFFNDFGFNPLTLGMFICVANLSFLSPVCVAPDILMFPPMVFSFPILLGIKRVLKFKL